MGVNVNELESSCQALGSLFTDLMISTKDGIPVFEDLINKSTKLSSSLRTAVVQLQQFLETFQKVADSATNSKGATKEIGKSLTRLCLRHRSIEQKLRSFGSSFVEELATPLSGMIEEWKQKSAALEKDRAKDTKRAYQDIKRASSDTIKLQKKAKKGKSDLMEKLDSAMQGVSEKYSKLEDCEKHYVRSALIDERKRYCDFICCLRPVVDREVSMIHEIQHLTEIIDHLSGLCADPESLPESSEQVINDLKGTNFSFKLKTPPDSPTSDRHSIASSVNSLVSAQDTESNRSTSPGRINTLTLKQRSHGSLEEEKSDSLSVYSSMSHSSHGSNEYDSVSLQSGSTHNVSIPTASRAHTISGSSKNSRPSLTNETYQPPIIRPKSVNSMQDYSNAASMMPPPPRPERMSSVPEDTPLTDPRRSSSLNMSTRTLPNKNRNKPKPVALPSVPFMNSEPIYMNTAQLAEQIAQKRRSDEAEKASLRSNDSQDMNQTLKNPVTKADEIQETFMSADFSAAVRELEASTAALQTLTDKELIRKDHQAQTDALADAIKELEATTAALDECIEEGTTSNKRQSVVSTATSDYCTATSNSSASEETIHIATDAPDSTNNMISETDTNLLPTSAGFQVSTPYGNATLRRNNGAKPPPPVRRNSHITATPSRSNSTRSSKPPVVSPKPKINTERMSRTSEDSRNSDSFPAPPTPIDLRSDDDPYAIPMNCQPIDVGALPPPPPEFGHDSPMFNISDLPPPIPDTPPQFHNTRLTPSNNNTTLVNTAQQNNTATTILPPWQKPNDKPKKQPPPVAAKKGKLHNDFMSQLNAKLGNNVSSALEQKPTTNDGQAREPSDQVQALASQKNTNASRNNLLSQIHSGARLKRTEIVNDRSSPRL